jgi:hypothetical protein
VDFERHSFVAWNPRFLEHTGFSEDEMKTSKAEELLTFGESWFPLSDEREGQRVEYIACAARRPFGGDPAPGCAVRSHGKIVYVMLDVFDSSSAQLRFKETNGEKDNHDNRTVSNLQAPDRNLSPIIINSIIPCTSTRGRCRFALNRRLVSVHGSALCLGNGVLDSSTRAKAYRNYLACRLRGGLCFSTSR